MPAAPVLGCLPFWKILPVIGNRPASLHINIHSHICSPLNMNSYNPQLCSYAMQKIQLNFFHFSKNKEVNFKWSQYLCICLQYVLILLNSSYLCFHYKFKLTKYLLIYLYLFCCNIKWSLISNKYFVHVIFINSIHIKHAYLQKYIKTITKNYLNV